MILLLLNLSLDLVSQHFDGLPGFGCNHFEAPTERLETTKDFYLLCDFEILDIYRYMISIIIYLNHLKTYIKLLYCLLYVYIVLYYITTPKYSGMPQESNNIPGSSMISSKSSNFAASLQVSTLLAWEPRRSSRKV